MSLRTFAFIGDGDALPSNRSGLLFALQAEIDCAENNVASGDIVKALAIPANTLVQDVIAVVETAEGDTLTLDVGDYLTADDTAVDADGYLDGTDGNTAAASKTSDTDTLGHFGGKFYTAASYIGVLFNNAASAAVIRIHAICVDCNA